MSQAQPQTQPQPEKPVDPYQKYKDFKWQNPEQFKNGPIDDETRKCRDCICCIIFIVLFALCIVVAFYSPFRSLHCCCRIWIQGRKTVSIVLLL